MLYILDLPDDGSTASLYSMPRREPEDPILILADCYVTIKRGARLKVHEGVFGFLRRALGALPRLDIEEDQIVI